jgi:hypothetical protein
MSLGWQSESALLPSKATPINVDSKSMMGMKALVYKLEHNLSAKAAGREGATYDRKVSRQSGPHQDRKLSKDDFSRHSKGDAKTKAKAEKVPRDDSHEISDKVAASLRAKAALYDQIINGNGSAQDSSQLQNSVATSGSGAFLINFDEKRKADDHDSYDRASKNSKYGDDREGDREGDNCTSSSSSSSSGRADHIVSTLLFFSRYIIVVIALPPFHLIVVTFLLFICISFLLHYCQPPLCCSFLFLFQHIPFQHIPILPVLLKIIPTLNNNNLIHLLCHILHQKHNVLSPLVSFIYRNIILRLYHDFGMILQSFYINK